MPPRSRASAHGAPSSLAVVGSRSAGAGAPTPRRPKTRAHVETLASPTLEGRLTGSTGERLAERLHRVASCRRSAPSRCPGQTDYPAAVRVHGRHARRRLARCAIDASAAQPRAGSTGDAATCRRCRSPTTATSAAPVVFAGYGIVVPDSQDFGYDSYATLDVKDKIVARPALLPGGRGPEDARHPGALRRPALQGDGGAAARREGDARRHRPAARRTPARSCR